MSSSALARMRSAAARSRSSLVLGIGLSVAAVTLAGATLPAEGETGPPDNSGAASCPASNPPDELTLAAGTPQTATLGSAFATNLQVAFANSDGCPVTTALAGIPVTFSAPTVGAGGSFSASDSSAVTVGSDASGIAVAPPFTADYAAGSYTITASSRYGSIPFSLTNVESSDSRMCGVPASGPASSADTSLDLAVGPTKLAAGIGATQATLAGARFPIALAVSVTDAEQEPVPGALVTFAAPVHGPSGYFALRTDAVQTLMSSARSAGASGSHPPRSRIIRRHRIDVRTDACGIALAPSFTANRHVGGYVVVASVEHLRAAFALVNEAR